MTENNLKPAKADIETTITTLKRLTEIHKDDREFYRVANATILQLSKKYFLGLL